MKVVKGPIEKLLDQEIANGASPAIKTSGTVSQLLQDERAIYSSLVDAIRRCTLVGRGTCSTIDECMEDQELVDKLIRDGIRTPSDALKWARDYEQLRLELALDARWGEDCDPQLKRLEDFMQRRSELEGGA